MKKKINHPTSLLGKRICQMAYDLGFTLAGITGATKSQYQESFKRWISQEKHGEMAYLAKHQPQRFDPQILLENAQSVICVADQYPTASTLLAPPPPAGKIARYAWGKDYHQTIKKRLFNLVDQLRVDFPEAQFKSSVDTAPVLERELASRAGIGWVGKNTLTIHPTQGSYLLLGQIVTTLAITPPATQKVITDHCGRCTKCLDACPTQCLTAYSVNATQCISYLTLEHRSTIDANLHPQMGTWIAGCDICQEVCPHNQKHHRRAEVGPLDLSAYHPHYEPRPPAPAIDLLAILNWTTQDRQQVFQGSSLKRIKLDMLKRNALIALSNFLNTATHNDAANSTDDYSDARKLQIKKRIIDISQDADELPLVRETALQIVRNMPSHLSND